jgi:hypothetical protein
MLGLVACSDRPPATSQTVTTGASMTQEEAHSRISELERERDEARAALAQERSVQAGERVRQSEELTSRSERDDLEVRVMNGLGKADETGQALRTKLLRGGGAKSAERARIEQALTDAHQIRAKIYADLRRLHGGTVGPSWDGFRAEVLKSLSDLDEALAVEPPPSP